MLPLESGEFGLTRSSTAMKQHNEMKSRLRQFGVVLIVVAVLLIFAAPAFAVQPTALRAARAAQQLLLAMAFAATMARVCAIRSIAFARTALASRRRAFPRVRIIDLTCSRLR